MKTIIITALVFLLILIVWGLNSVPKKRALRKEYHFKSNINSVWQKVRDIEGQTKWRSDISKIEILSKNPEVWKETATNEYSTTFQTIKLSEKSEWVMQVIDPPFINARWTGKFIEKDNGTSIIFEETIEIDPLPQRILSFLFLDLEKLMMTYLKDLSISLEETWDEKRVKTTLE